MDLYTTLSADAVRYGACSCRSTGQTDGRTPDRYLNVYRIVPALRSASITQIRSKTTHVTKQLWDILTDSGDCALQDILQNKDIHLDGILIASLVFDLLKVRFSSKLLFLDAVTNDQSAPGVETFVDNGGNAVIEKEAGCLRRSRRWSRDDGICVNTYTLGKVTSQSLDRDRAGFKCVEVLGRIIIRGQSK